MLWGTEGDRGVENGEDPGSSEKVGGGNTGKAFTMM